MVRGIEEVRLEVEDEKKEWFCRGGQSQRGKDEGRGENMKKKRAWGTDGEEGSQRTDGEEGSQRAEK